MQRAATSVMKIVRGVAQVVGLHTVPATPRDMEGLRQWYYEVLLGMFLKFLAGGLTSCRARTQS